jgi:hypothetical protein
MAKKTKSYWSFIIYMKRFNLTTEGKKGNEVSKNTILWKLK